MLHEVLIIIKVEIEVVGLVYRISKISR